MKVTLRDYKANTDNIRDMLHTIILRGGVHRIGGSRDTGYTYWIEGVQVTKGCWDAVPSKIDFEFRVQA